MSISRNIAAWLILQLLLNLFTIHLPILVLHRPGIKLTIIMLTGLLIKPSIL